MAIGQEANNNYTTNSEKKVSNGNWLTKFAWGVGQAWNLISGKQQQMDQAEKEAQKQRDFDERMSNTAIQRQSADAKAAGVNTAMLYSNSASSGASTPNGAAASGTASGSSPFGDLPSLVNSAANLSRSFNSDKNENNDVNLKQVLNTVATAARLFK